MARNHGIDPKRKGIMMVCRTCDKPTKHIPYGVLDETLQEFEENKVVHSKIHTFICSECGSYRTRSKW